MFDKRLIHELVRDRHCRVSSNRELKKDKNNEYERSSRFSFNKLEKF